MRIARGIPVDVQSGDAGLCLGSPASSMVHPLVLLRGRARAHGVRDYVGRSAECEQCSVVPVGCWASFARERRRASRAAALLGFPYGALNWQLATVAVGSGNQVQGRLRGVVMVEAGAGLRVQQPICPCLSIILTPVGCQVSMAQSLPRPHRRTGRQDRCDTRAPYN